MWSPFTNTSSCFLLQRERTLTLERSNPISKLICTLKPLIVGIIPLSKIGRHITYWIGRKWQRNYRRTCLFPPVPEVAGNILAEFSLWKCFYPMYSSRGVRGPRLGACAHSRYKENTTMNWPSRRIWDSVLPPDRKKLKISIHPITTQAI